MNETEKFLKDMEIPGTRTEITAMFDGKIKTIKESEIESYKHKSNLYYLPGVDPGLEFWKRARDFQMLKKNSFTLDIDIRSQFDGELTNLEIVKEGLTFAKILKDHHRLFGQWSKIIFTGNGLHIVYIGETKTFNHKQYKLGVKAIFKLWDEFIGDKTLFTDPACCNAGRILRIPGSINQKNGSRVKILVEKNIKSELFDNIKIYGLINAYSEIIKAETMKKEMAKKSYKSDTDNFYKEINEKIPAYELAQILIPEFPFDGSKNFKNKKGGVCGYFYNKDTNTIVNGGSRYFLFDGDANSCWNNFSIIKHWYSYDNKEVFQWFENKFNTN